VADAPGLQVFLAGIFSHRRQTLGNALKHHLGERWTAAFKESLGDFDLARRPENFAIEQLLGLAARCAEGSL
jgi:16S rRNA A1518/A1519 N6-dimethyltransferase RsmA/KsgA/DIM1 with predicted DNA glycosylase/AP lyase activity